MTHHQFGYKPQQAGQPGRLIESVAAEVFANEARYLPVDVLPEKPDTYGFYKYAEQLAADCDLSKTNRVIARLNGSFIFGDFIEAFFKRYDIHTKRLLISTYSMSIPNVDSLANLLNDGYVDSLDLLINDGYYAHEHKPGGIIEYLLKTLDQNNRLQLAVCHTHDKLCHFVTDGGRHISMYGSANLRSSGSIEHVTIENNKDVHDFYVDSLNRVLARYQIIRKPILHSELWTALVNTIPSTPTAAN